MKQERGIALVLSLFLMTAMSVVAASLMFLAQTETYSSMNYTVMSQARYGAESGLQKAANYLMNSYTAPTTGGTDPLSNYDMTKSPVTYMGQAVVLSANPTVEPNYPVDSIQTAFAAAVQGTMQSGNTTVTYQPYATLLTMQPVSVYGAGVVKTIQTWQISSLGTIGSGRTAQVEVVGFLESGKSSASMYAAFATSPTCGAQQFAGGATTDSYSALDGSGLPVLVNTGGDIGTNGNLTESGGALIHGTLSTPRVGVGNCSHGNVNALTSGGGATLDGGVVQLPQAVTFVAPTIPATPNGNYSPGTTTLSPGTYADVKLTSSDVLTLTAGTYNMNSISVSGQAKIVIASGPVIINIGGSGSNVVDLTGQGSVVNTTYDGSMFQINYGGTGGIKLAGGASYCMMVYAPNSDISFSGNSDFYGSVVGKTIKDTGGAHLHFDKNLEDKFFVVGNGMLSGFSWKKY